MVNGPLVFGEPACFADETPVGNIFFDCLFYQLEIWSNDGSFLTVQDYKPLGIGHIYT
jgi:hypothetical protein